MSKGKSKAKIQSVRLEKILGKAEKSLDKTPNL